jgi:hypothetical protein
MFSAKAKSWIGGLILLACVVAAPACATRDARIKRNQALFESLPPATQNLIREGKVAIGFTAEEVLLALGDPDQRWVRMEAAGRTEIWSYTTYDSAAGVPLYRGYYHRYAGLYPFFYDNLYRDTARPREYFRVVFSGGRVSEIEEASR